MVSKLTKLTFEISGKSQVFDYGDAYTLYEELNKIFGNKTLLSGLPPTGSMGGGPIGGIGGGLTKQYDPSAFYYGEKDIAAENAYAPSLNTDDTITLNSVNMADAMKSTVYNDFADRPRSAFNVF